MDPVTDFAQLGCSLSLDVSEPAEIVLQVAAAAPESQTLTVASGGRVLDLAEVGGGQQVVHAPVGLLTVEYAAQAGPLPEPPPVTELERIEALRPSRYCPSDKVIGFAATLFGPVTDEVETARRVVRWVQRHLTYAPGSSGPGTDALDTLLEGRGVCRDYAHVVATLCRALDIPARVAAVYAPGLSPMDFHLVTETALGGVWRVWDATGLAPRQTLVRIATGRDAADTAFVTNLSGALTVQSMEILAVAAGDLPADDQQALISLP